MKIHIFPIRFLALPFSPPVIPMILFFMKLLYNLGSFTKGDVFLIRQQPVAQLGYLIVVRLHRAF